MGILGKAMSWLWRSPGMPCLRHPAVGQKEINRMFTRCDVLILVLWCVIVAAFWAGSSTKTPPLQLERAGEMDREDPAREEMLRKLRNG